MEYLRSAGMSAEEIDRLLPKSSAERRSYVASRANDATQMKKDIAYLKEQVEYLKANRPHKIDQDREAGFQEIDERHAKKRAEHEAELLRKHPDFKPGHRLKDETPVEAI